MSDANVRYDDRDASLFDDYGPLYYGPLMVRDESGGAQPCPPVDYNDPACSPWNIRRSLRVAGRSEGKN